MQQAGLICFPGYVYFTNSSPDHATCPSLESRSGIVHCPLKCDCDTAETEKHGFPPKKTCFKCESIVPSEELARIVRQDPGWQNSASYLCNKAFVYYLGQALLP